MKLSNILEARYASEHPFAQVVKDALEDTKSGRISYFTHTFDSAEQAQQAYNIIVRVLGEPIEAGECGADGYNIGSFCALWQEIEDGVSYESQISIWPNSPGESTFSIDVFTQEDFEEDQWEEYD